MIQVAHRREQQNTLLEEAPEELLRVGPRVKPRHVGGEDERPMVQQPVHRVVAEVRAVVHEVGLPPPPPPAGRDDQRVARMDIGSRLHELLNLYAPQRFDINLDDRRRSHEKVLDRHIDHRRAVAINVQRGLQVGAALEPS